MTDGLQFDKAEFEAPPPGQPTPAGVTCSFCGQPLRRYWAVTDKVACEACHERVVEAVTSGSGAARFVRAVAYGVGAGALILAAWLAARAAVKEELLFVAVFVGLGIGAAVRAGSRHRGGLAYQLLAVALTYVTICASFVPFLLEKDDGSLPAVVVWVGAMVISLAAPILGITEAPILIFIFGIAFWDAWRRNAWTPLPITGPHEVAATPPPTTPPTTPPSGQVPVA